ncbi:hypothetical protein GCM10010466_25980 [Planomonospora alba]|uniref:Uncharacterized protein n=1 Tax=Planomonospora alba TaxID=161354 RepID=A0ABP6N260_9ACTN
MAERAGLARDPGGLPLVLPDPAGRGAAGARRRWALTGAPAEAQTGRRRARGIPPYGGDGRLNDENDENDEER